MSLELQKSLQKITQNKKKNNGHFLESECSPTAHKTEAVVTCLMSVELHGV